MGIEEFLKTWKSELLLTIFYHVKIINLIDYSISFQTSPKNVKKIWLWVFFHFKKIDHIQTNNCEIIEKISPKPGRLVVFLNSHKSLHAVSEMKNHKGLRHFLYGSFTLLGKKNQFLSKSHGSLSTEYNLFD